MRCSVALRRFLHGYGKRRETPPPIPSGAGVGKMGFWRATGAVRCRARYREERFRGDSRGGKERAGFASVRKRRHDASQLRGQTIVAATRIRRGG